LSYQARSARLNPPTAALDISAAPPDTEDDGADFFLLPFIDDDMSGPRLLSEAIPAIAGKAFSRKYIMLGRLVTRWADIIGVELAARTQPVKIRYYKNKKQAAKAGTGEKPTASLDIACSTADATLLHYQKDLILERINQIFGDKWITAIRFVPQAANLIDVRQGGKKPAKSLTEAEKTGLSEAIAAAGPDDELRRRLESLGASILKKD
jgi:hypothetical protein